MYKTSEMVYSHSYKWNAKADHDNPKIINGNEASELNRDEGYEMIYFINSLGKTWKWSGEDKVAYQKLEKAIKTKVPSNIRTHGGIKNWIEQNFKSFWDSI